MAYARRNVTSDIWNNRAWTADATVDLASIPSKHGDTAYVTANGQVYLYLDGIGWSPVAGGVANSVLQGLGASAVAAFANNATLDSLVVTNAVVAADATITGTVLTSGVQFSSDVLSSYAVSTWTPGLAFGGGTTGLTYASGGQDGHYIKIGRFVYATFRVELSAKGSSTGTAALTGLPFTSANTDDYGAAFMGAAVNLAGLTSAPTMLVIANNTVCSIYDWGATGIANMDDTNFTDTSVIAGGAMYMSAS